MFLHLLHPSVSTVTSPAKGALTPRQPPSSPPNKTPLGAQSRTFVPTKFSGCSWLPINRGSRWKADPITRARSRFSEKKKGKKLQMIEE
ncbi:Quinone oxidoreductase 2 [Fusarium oxysporum f. sp. albedinis]|nr:Quinone oxidoreductase 2 [Fusarium oxysporum f. sp. albedinis]